MKIFKEEKHFGLCYRCEHRARFKETGGGPRSECQSDISVMGCYTYQPVTPIIFKPRKGDRRLGIPGSIISSRIDRVGLLKWKMVVEKDRNGTVLYKIPLTKEDELAMKETKKLEEKRFKKLKELIKKSKQLK